MRLHDTENPDFHSNSSVLHFLRNGLENYLHCINGIADYFREDLKYRLMMHLCARRFARHLQMDFKTLTKDMPADHMLLAILMQPARKQLATLDFRRSMIFYAGAGLKGQALNAPKNGKLVR